MSNDRKSKRFSCIVPIDGREGGLFDQTLTVDFSKGGLGFVSRRRIPLNEEIPIEIDLTADGRPVFVLGQVRWAHRIVDTQNYRIGISFKNIMRGSKAQLTEYFKKNKVS